MQTVTMMTRFLHAVAYKNTKALGGFEIIGTMAQANAAKRLYRFLIESEGSPEHQPLLEHAHCLMDTIVRSKNTTESHIACPPDQAACLSLLKPDDHYGMANYHSRWFSMLQHNFFDITAHSARLKFGGHESYVSIEAGKSQGLGPGELAVNDDMEQRSVRGEFTVEGALHDNDGLDLDIEEDAEEEERRLLEADRDLLLETQIDGDEDGDEDGDDTSKFF